MAIPTPGPGAYSPTLQSAGRPADMEHNATKQTELVKYKDPVTIPVLPGKESRPSGWVRSSAGLLVPPPSQAQCAEPQRPAYPKLGIGAEMAVFSERRGRADYYANLIRPQLGVGDDALYSRPSRYPPRTPDNAHVGLWWHHPRGDAARQGVHRRKVDGQDVSGRDLSQH